MLRSFVFILMITLSPLVTSATVIRVHEAAYVDNVLISLQDIATISEADEQIKQQLNRATIAPAPEQGRSLRITVDQIRRELALRGIDQTNIQITGSSEVAVTRGKNPALMLNGQTANADTIKSIESAIARYLNQQDSQKGRFDVKLSPQSLSSLPAHLTKGTPLKVNGGQSPWTGVQKIQIQSMDTKLRPVTTSVFCDVMMKPRLLALRHGLARGQIIQETDLVWLDTAEEDLTSGFTNPEDLTGTETTTSIRAMVPIRVNDIREIPLVRRNEIISVTAKVGTISVRRLCKSTSDGTKGQTITLIPIDGKDRITARVTGYREAMIDLAPELTAAQSQTPYQANTQPIWNDQTDNVPSSPLKIQYAPSSPPGQYYSQQQLTPPGPPASRLTNQATLEVQIQANQPATLSR